MPAELPQHLRRYVVEQDYSRYTPVDQEVWRHIMRQLKSFLPAHAHPCYLEGLRKTGIEVESVPDIARMSEKLEKFGWRAIPVSGFIPPAAFMELQALGYLPIASDLRTIDHLMYTPAPDIVHEAAGHAPILVDPAFAAYLKSYAQVARRAIISKEDLDQYDAIRLLSDLKEDPHSTPKQIEDAEARLGEVTKNISHLSEAALLGRMNWWTAEYGLLGSLENPKIFGAGLLSSIGEARTCLSSKVKKIPFSLECIDYAYDITEPQPQLFVTPDFETLGEVLEQLASRMAFRLGGAEGLKRARLAATINTIELNSGLQISGRLKDFIVREDSTSLTGTDGSVSAEPAYLQFDSPTQLCLHGKELVGHGTSTHAHGFGSPVGHVKGLTKCLSELSEDQLETLGLVRGRNAHLQFVSGVEVHGEVTGFTRAPNGRLVLISFRNCRVTLGDKLLFDPSWGSYDMAIGSRVVSVFGGPADRAAYGETDDFVAKKIARKQHSPLMQHKHRLFAEVRAIREGLGRGSLAPDQLLSNKLDALVETLEADFPHEWLLRVSLLELATKVPSASWKPRLEIELKNLGDSDPQVKTQIEDGLRVFGVD